MGRPAATAAVFVGVTAVLWASPARIVNDSHYTLLVAETILRTGWFHLDDAFVRPLPSHLYPGFKRRTGLPYHVTEAGSHVVPFYPPGSSLLSVPFVAVANALGKRVVSPEGLYRMVVEGRLQRLLAALLVGATAAIMFLSAELRLRRPAALAVTLAAVFGTPLWSSASRAVWADTWGVLLLALVVHGLLREAAGGPWPRMPVMGTLLALLFLVKPTYATSILPVTAYVAVRQPRKLPALLATGAAWLGLFLWWSHAVYGDVLPPYYRLRPSTDVLAVGVLESLVSPSRGLLVFSPIVLAVLAGVAWWWRHVAPHALALAALAASVLHVAAYGSHYNWWGGVCYGPRYMTGLVPWLFALALLWLSARPPGCSRAAAAAVGALLAVSVAMHGRGALSHATSHWNASPWDVDEHRVWDWRYPQFAAGLVPPRLPAELPELLPGAPIHPIRRRTRAHFWYGWGDLEGDGLWSDGRRAEVIFGLRGEVFPATLVLEMRPFLRHPDTLGQRVVVHLDGEAIARFALSDDAFTRVAIPVPPGRLGKRNRLVLELPDGVQRGDRRPAIAIREAVLERDG